LLGLKILLSEIRTAMDAEDHERAYWITLVAHTKAFAIFPGEIDERARTIRARFFGDAPVKRRKPLPTRTQSQKQIRNGDGIENLVPASRFELLTPRV
jgi:hypothetical protein